MQQTNENPGARSGAAGGSLRKAEGDNLKGNYALKAQLLATHFWDRGAGSVERLKLERREGWA